MLPVFKRRYELAASRAADIVYRARAKLSDSTFESDATAVVLAGGSFHGHLISKTNKNKNKNKSREVAGGMSKAGQTGIP